MDCRCFGMLEDFESVVWFHLFIIHVRILRDSSRFFGIFSGF